MPAKFPCQNSRPEMFCKKGVLRNFETFTEIHLCQGLSFNKVPGLRHEPQPENEGFPL